MKTRQRERERESTCARVDPLSAASGCHHMLFWLLLRVERTDMQGRHAHSMQKWQCSYEFCFAVLEN